MSVGLPSFECNKENQRNAADKADIQIEMAATTTMDDVLIERMFWGKYGVCVETVLALIEQECYWYCCLGFAFLFVVCLSSSNTFYLNVLLSALFVYCKRNQLNRLFHNYWFPSIHQNTSFVHMSVWNFIREYPIKCVMLRNLFTRMNKKQIAYFHFQYTWLGQCYVAIRCRCRKLKRKWRKYEMQKVE